MTDNNELLENIARIKSGKMHEAAISAAIAEELLYGILRFVIVKNDKGCQKGDRVRFINDFSKSAPRARKLRDCVFVIDYVWNGEGLDKGYAGLALTLEETDDEDVIKSWQLSSIAENARITVNTIDAGENYARERANQKIGMMKSEFDAMDKYRKMAEEKGWRGISGIVFVEKDGALVDSFKSLQSAAAFLGVEATMLAGMSMTKEPRIINGFKIQREPIKWVEPNWTHERFALERRYREEYRKAHSNKIPTI